MSKYYLISDEAIEQINSNIVVMNKAAQFMRNAGYENFSDTIIAYNKDIGALVNNAIECNVIPGEK